MHRLRIPTEWSFFILWMGGVGGMVVLLQAIDSFIAIIGGGVGLFLPLLISSLIILFIFNFIQHRTRWKWVGTALLTLYLVWLAIFLVVQFLAILQANAQYDPTLIPETIRSSVDYAGTQPDLLATLAQAALQSLISAAIFTLISMPFAFLGVMAFDVIKGRTQSVWISILLTVILGSLVLTALMYFFPWILTGLIYLAFFGL